MTLTATEDWFFVQDENWPEVVKFAKYTDDKGKEQTYKAKHDEWGNLSNPETEIASKTSSWLTTASAVKGGAGEYKVEFSAEKVAGGREIELRIVAGSNTQYLRIRQGSLEASNATCAEVLAGPDGKTYRVKGTCTSIIQTTYGNWYLNDGTGEVYIYGTLDAKGAEKNFSSLGIEVGDVVEVEGPKTTYGSTIELVNVTVIKLTKSLAKLVTEDATYPKEGGEFDVKVAYKGSNFNPSVPAELRDWVSVVEVKTVEGVPTKIEKNPADTAVVTIKLGENEGADRKGQVDFASGSSKVSHNFTQEGAIIDATAAVVNAAEDGPTQYRLTGYVSKIANTQYGNLYIKDYTGEVYVYGTNDFAASGIEEGDIITVVGPKTSYKEAPQMKNVTLEKRIDVKDISLADFRNLPDDKTAYYRISGTVAKSTEENTKFDLEQYGNFALKDGDTEVYVYGVVAGWGGSKGQFGALGVKEGDELTIVCYKTSYKGLIEADGCFYVSHEAAGGEDPEPGVPGEVLYTLDATGTLQGSNNSYAGNCDIVSGDITWNVTGNTQQNPWRLGGKSLDAVDRAVYTKTAFANELSKVVLTLGTANLTVNSCKLLYSTSADFAGAAEIAFDYKEGAIELAPESGKFPANCYYKFVFNVTVTGSSSNKYVQFSKVEFVG